MERGEILKYLNDSIKRMEEEIELKQQRIEVLRNKIGICLATADILVKDSKPTLRIGNIWKTSIPAKKPPQPKSVLDCIRAVVREGLKRNRPSWSTFTAFEIQRYAKLWWGWDLNRESIANTFRKYKRTLFVKADVLGDNTIVWRFKKGVRII